MLIQILLAVVTLTVGNGGDVATPAEALVKVREWRKSGKVQQNEVVEVRLKAETFELTETLKFGNHDHDIVFCGADGMTSVISGGIELDRFTAGSDGIWRAKVPAGMKFHQMWVGGKRAVCAREPNLGKYFYVKGGDEFTKFEGHAEELSCMKGLSDEEIKKIVMRVYWSWETEWTWLKSVDFAKNEVHLQTKVYEPWFKWRLNEPRYHLENFRAALNAPGEWFYDEKTSQVLYLPRPGEAIESCRAVVPRLGKIIDFKGTSNIVFKNVAIRYAGWMVPPWFFTCQSANGLKYGNIHVEYSKDIHFEGCTIEHTSTYAFWFNWGAKDCSVKRCLVRDGGAGAVEVGFPVYKFESEDFPDKVPARIVVDNCIFTKLGRVHPEGSGIFFSIGTDCRFTHNEICDLYYTGISLGMRWSFVPTYVRGTYVANNHIHHFGQGVLSDFGGIYSLGRNLDTLVTGNVIHDCWDYGYTGAGSEGIYSDTGTSYITYRSNLVYRVKGQCYYGNESCDNLIEDNVFCKSEYSVKDNIVKQPRPPKSRKASVIRNNEILEKDPDSAIVQRFMAKAGVYGDKKWRAFAENLKMPEYVAPPKPPRYKPKPYRSFGFEEAWKKGQKIPQPMGTQPKGLGVSITNEDSFKGKQCIKVVDSPETPTFEPYVRLFMPKAEKKSIISFALKYFPDTDCQFLIRQTPPPEGVKGPFVPGFWINFKKGKMEIDAFREIGGKLKNVQVPVNNAPTGEWLYVTLEVEQVSTSRSTGVVSVRCGDKTEVCEKLYLAGNCRVPTWFGFLSYGASEKNIYFIDEVSYRID